VKVKCNIHPQNEMRAGHVDIPDGYIIIYMHGPKRREARNNCYERSTFGVEVLLLYSF
jgi:hypothetical protein